MPELTEVVSLIVDHLRQTMDDPPELDASSALLEDAQLDSMQSFEMVAALEDHYGIDIPVESLQGVKTIQDVGESVLALLRRKETVGA